MKNVLSFMAIILLSCQKVDVPKGTPKCIKAKIKDEKDDDLKKVYEYQYKERSIYQFIKCPATLNPGNTCDDSLIGFFTDEHCNYVCDASPPIVPNGNPSCVEVYKEATNKKLIWQQ